MSLCKSPKMLRTCYFILVLICVVGFIQGRPQTIERNETITSNDTGEPRTRVSFKVNKHDTGTDILRDLLGELVGDIEDQDIIFPDTYQAIFNHIPKIEDTPKCAKSSTFCEDFENYPYHHVKDILKRKRVRNGLFGKDEPLEDPYSISNRNGDIEAFVCASIQKTIFPRLGKNKNNKWKYIINQEELDGYIQGIRVEICRREGSPCELIGDSAPGYITSCKQKFMLRRLMSLTDDGDPIADSFQIPSACCCSYRKDLTFLSRFGEVSTRTKTKDL